jgi:hypothetical protein
VNAPHSTSLWFRCRSRSGAGQAIRYQRLLDEWRYASMTEMAEAERLDCGYMGRLLQLTLLAPDLIEMLLDGGDGFYPDLPSLMEPLPSAWLEQRLAARQLTE